MFSVSLSWSSGPSKHKREIGKSTARSASSNAARASGNFSETSRPIPAYWEPCPGNTNAIFKSYVTPAVFVIPSLVNSVSISRLTLCLQKSFATRIAFLIAFGLERPWQTMVMPLMPNNGAPPYSE